MAVYKLSKAAKNDLANIYEFGIAEYLRYLVRKDEERNREFLMTKAAIQERLDSGINANNRTAKAWNYWTITTSENWTPKA